MSVKRFRIEKHQIFDGNYNELIAEIIEEDNGLVAVFQNTKQYRQFNSAIKSHITYLAESEFDKTVKRIIFKDSNDEVIFTTKQIGGQKRWH